MYKIERTRVATATLYGIETLLTDTIITTGMRNAQIKPPSRLSQQLQKEESEKQLVKHLNWQYNINDQKNAYYFTKKVHGAVYL